MTTQITHAIGYVRFSDPAQKKGGSLARQREKLIAFAAQHGWSIDIIKDEGFSAYLGHHRQAHRAFGNFEQEALEGAHIGTVLIVERLDRLSRLKPSASYRLFCDLLNAGVSVATIDDGKIYPAYQEPELVETLVLFIRFEGNHQESLKKASHITLEWEKRRNKARETGKALTKMVPPWLRVDRNRMIHVIPERAALVKRIFDLADQGYGAGAIAVLLNKEGVAPWPRYDSRPPRTWGRTFVGRLLVNRAVMGEFQPMQIDPETGKRTAKEEPWADYYPRVVEADVFERVYAAAAGRKTFSNGRRDSKIANIFGTKLTCRSCGGRLRYITAHREGTVQKTKAGGTTTLRRTNASLICPVAHDHGGCDNRAYWAYLTFEDAVLNAVLHLAMDDQAFANRGEAGRLNAEIASQRRSMELAKQKASNLWGVYAENPSDILLLKAKAFEAEATGHEQNIELLESRLQVAHGKTDGAQHLRRVKDVQADLYHPDLEIRIPLRRKVALSVQALIDRIYFTGELATVTLVDKVAVLTFDRKGKLIAGLDLHKEGRNAPRDYKRRREAAKVTGAVFGEISTSTTPITVAQAIEMLGGGTPIRAA